MNQYNKWTQDEKEKLRNNYQLRREELLALFPNRSASSVYQRATILGLTKIHNEYCESNTSILLNESLETYYWLGFIMADGHISNSYRLSIGLAIKDCEHLNRFATYIQCKNIKYHKQNTIVSIKVQDKIYIKQLKEKFNICNDKTYNPCNIKKIKSKKLFLAWLIGYIDGDGCIKNQHKRKDCSLGFHVHSSWLKILKLIKYRLNQLFNIGSGQPTIGKDGYARYNIADSRLLIKLKKFVIRNNLPALTRKWNKINITYISKYEITRNRVEKIKIFIKQGLKQKDMAKILGISGGAVSTLIKRKHLLEGASS